MIRAHEAKKKPLPRNSKHPRGHMAASCTCKFPRVTPTFGAPSNGRQRHKLSVCVVQCKEPWLENQKHGEQQSHSSKIETTIDLWQCRTMIVRMLSTAQSGYFYTTKRIRQGPSLAAVKYDPRGSSFPLLSPVKTTLISSAVKARVLFVESRKTAKK